MNIEKMRVGEYVGSGAEKKVYQDITDPEKVIGVYSLPPESARKLKAQFYLTKILHFIFPKNIPDIYLVASDPARARKRKVDVDESHQIIQRVREMHLQGSEVSSGLLGQSASAKRKIYSDSRYLSFLAELEKIGIQIDDNAINFTYDDSGNIIYLDDIDPWFAFATEEGYDRNKIFSALDTIQDSAMRERAALFAQRLDKLIQEELSAEKGTQ